MYYCIAKFKLEGQCLLVIFLRLLLSMKLVLCMYPCQTTQLPFTYCLLVILIAGALVYDESPCSFC